MTKEVAQPKLERVYVSRFWQAYAPHSCQFSYERQHRDDIEFVRAAPLPDVKGMIVQFVKARIAKLADDGISEANWHELQSLPAEIEAMDWICIGVATDNPTGVEQETDQNSVNAETASSLSQIVIPKVNSLNADLQKVRASNDVDVVVSGSLLVIRTPHFQQDAKMAVLTHPQAHAIIRALIAVHGNPITQAGATASALSTTVPDAGSVPHDTKSSVVDSVEAPTKELNADGSVFYPGIVDQKILLACLTTADLIIRDPRPDRIERFRRTKAKLIAQVKARPLSFDEWNATQESNSAALGGEDEKQNQS